MAVKPGMRHAEVLEMLYPLLLKHGKPHYIRSDNGSGFIARELQAWLRKAGEERTLLDIREEEELAIASIDGAVHIPMNTLPENLEMLFKNHPIIVMCHVGSRSARLADL